MRQSLGAQDTWRAIKDGGYGKTNKRLNTGMAPTCDWMIKIVKVNKLYFNSLLVSIVNRVSRSGTMKYQCERKHRSVQKEMLTYVAKEGSLSRSAKSFSDIPAMKKSSAD